MSLRLRIEHGHDAGKTWGLPRPGVYTLGRKTDVSLRVLDMKVSGHHCEIRVAGDGADTRAVIHDLGSTHGCLVNGQPLKRDKALNPGDELRLGMTIIRVLSAGAADEDIQPAAGRQADMTTADAGNGAAGHTKTTLPADDLVGKDLGGYQIERKIGAGGMGGVYLAEQTSLKRKVALKVLNEKFASDSAFVDQFVNEARAAGALNHPNVVQVYDVGSAAGHYFFSMEVMPGGSIEDKVREGPIEWETGLNWFIDASNALIFANRREILHRDVKPDNLMIGEDDSAKLCDLGLAKKSEVSDLMDHGIIGTPHFISPEAIRRKNDIDHRTDLYSLGCSFYRIFSGQNPFPGTSVKEILLGHLNRPVPHISAVNRDVPKELDEVVAQLMAKDPDDRIQTPEELLRVLDKIRTTYNLEAHGIKPASKKPLLILAAVAVVAIGGLSIFIANREDTVVVGELSPEKQARLRAADQARAEKRVDTSALKTKFGELALRLSEEDIEEGENWKKPIFPELSGKFTKLADFWTAKADNWRAERADLKDDVVRGYYDTALATVDEYAGKARAEAKGIDDYIEGVEKNQAEFAAKRKAALAELKTKVEAYVKKLAQFMQNGQYVELETSLKKNEIDDIVKPLLAKSVGRRKLLKEKEDVRPLLDKLLPGDKDGKNRGQHLVKQAVEFIKRGSRAKTDEAKAALGDKPSHTQYRDATPLLKNYLEGLATITPEAKESAPLASAAYTGARQTAQTMKESLEKRHLALVNAEFRKDRQVYFDLLKTLWAPRDRGLLQRFEFVGAKAAAKRAVQEDLSTTPYRKLAQDWVLRVEALDGLFKNLVAGFPDAWAEDHFFELDAKGKKKRKKIKAIDDRGFTVGRDKFLFADMGPRWLLEYLFYVEEGQARLKACSPADHHGLALLSEMAIQYAAAEKHYMSAARDADSAKADLVRRRMKHLDLERQAGERWGAVRDWLLLTETGEARFRAMYEGQALDPDAFPKEARGEALDWLKEVEKRMQAIQGMREELNERRDLAGTWWGSCLRTAPHPEVAYGGEKLPPAPKKDAPTKDGDKKDGGKKDGDKKDPPPENGGGKKKDGK